MSTVQISARVDRTLKTAIERYCRTHGIVINHFVQEALFDRLEELEDIEDLKRIRHEPTRPLAEALKELKLNGELCSRHLANRGKAASSAAAKRA